MWIIQRTAKAGPYTYAVVPEHPDINEHGYVYEHRVVMENHLGRLLNADEIVHHRDHNKHNNGLDNLELITRSEHARRHALERGRLYVVLNCPACGSEFEKPKSQTQGTAKKIFVACSPRCRGIFSRKLQLEGRTPPIEAAIIANFLREYRKFPALE